MHLSVGYPPDTETPGYSVEETTKPEICRAVNAALRSELFPPRAVAACIVRGIERGTYHLPSPDFGQNLLIDYTAGIAPGMLGEPLTSLLSPIVSGVLSFLRWRADAAAARCNRRAAGVA